MTLDPTVNQRNDLSRAVLQVADVVSIEAPRAIKRYLLPLNKLSFRYNATPMSLPSACDIFVVYGLFERAYKISLLVGEIDHNTWGLDYNYVRSAIHHTAYAANKLGFRAEAAALDPLLRIPADYSPQPRRMQGLGLRLPFEKMDVWRSQPVDMTSSIVSEAFVDLRALSTMWLFGGSAEWPRERIDALYDSTVEQIKALRGWEQW